MSLPEEKALGLKPQHGDALTPQGGDPRQDTAAAPSKGLRLEDAGVYEMLWDCPYCGTPKLLGKTHRFCPNCGAGQDPKKRYFPAEEEKIAVKDHVYFGVDRVCSACTTPSSANAEFCMQCGAPLSEAARAKIQAEQVRGDGETWQADQPAAPKPTSKKKWWLLGGLVLLILTALVLVFWTKDVSLIMNSHSWTREIEIEDYAPRQQDAWCDAMPGDAYRVSRRPEVRSHRQVPDGETCSMRRVDRGDGTYAERRECRPRYRSEPVYDDKCAFTVDRWARARVLKSGAADLEPRWPPVHLARSGQCVGCEREGQRAAQYYLHLQDSASLKQYECAVAENQWRAAPLRSRWQMEVGVLDGIARCGSLEAAP